MYINGDTEMIEKTTREFVIDALFSIRPNSEFIMGDTYDSLKWISKNQVKPTEAEFDTALASVKSNHDAQEYARNRATEYPAIAEQLDEIYHNGIDSWKAVIKVTKDKYPKG